jgi:hypothetical protein
MAGTLVITTLSDGTNSTSSTNCIQGSAKAWVCYNGAAGTIKGSYNVGSVTKNGTGNYTLNFTTALADANYSSVLSAPSYSTSNGTVIPFIYGSGTVGNPAIKTTTQLQIAYMATGGTYFDPTDISVTCNR